MKKVLFSLFVVMVTFASCGTDAVKFNDTIVNEERSLEAPITEYSNKLGQAMASNSYEGIKELGDSLLLKIDKSIEVIKNLKTPSGGEKFKETSIEYFESAKKIVALGNKAESLGSEPTEEQVTAFSEEYGNMIKEIAERTNAYLAVQKEFAKEKNMKLK
ncbi:MAG: hypothetical protein LBR46_03295 [Prevotella sp.]|jgi:hypothetical protein|nr:hypothetical protein [Prevotella sp.]